MSKEKIIEEKFDSGNDSVTITAYAGRCVEFEIDEPWYGSTEQGFGATLRISVPWDDIKPLLQKIYLFMDSHKNED